MIFFTSDHHFYHSNVIKHCNRPFSSVSEMNRVMIVNWNKVVGSNDTVYHLGDLCFGGLAQASRVLRELNGDITVLYNSWHHDRRWLPKEYRPQTYEISRSGDIVKLGLPITVLKFPEYGDGRHPKTLVLSHYPQLYWDCKHYGSWHLFGHSHGRVSGNGLSMDVGVDCNNFTPVSLDQVVKRMTAIQLKM